MYKLSIVIPIYKVEKYIQECLESFIFSISPQVEVIIVNDGTPDESMKIIRTIISKLEPEIQSQFVLIDQDNHGLSVARNKGVQAASGQYVTFLDSDDKLNEDYFTEILPHLNNYKYDLIDFNMITSEGKLIKTSDDSLQGVFSLMNWFSQARIIKKDIINRHPFTPGIYYEDLDTIPKIYLEAESIFHLEKTLYWYRTNNEGITRSLSLENSITTINSLEMILQSYYALYKKDNNPFYTIPLMQSFYMLCINACKRFSLQKSYHYLKKYEYMDININKKVMPIDYKILDKKFLAFSLSPKLYIYIYSSYFYFKDKFF